MDNIGNQDAEGKLSPLYRNIFSVARIGGYAALLSLAGSVIGAIAGFTKPIAAVSLPAKEGFEEVDVQQLAQSSTYFFVTLSLIISVVTFYFLFRFSKLAQSALLRGDSIKLSEALQSLAKYFKIWGILLFLMMFFFGLLLLGGMLNGAAGG